MTYKVSFNAVAYIYIEADSEEEALELVDNKIDWHEYEYVPIPHFPLGNNPFVSQFNFVKIEPYASMTSELEGVEI